MRPIRSRGAAAVAATVGAILSVGSIAWACTDAMMGTVWFCPTSSFCFPEDRITSLSDGATAYSQAAGLNSRGATYRLRYVSGTNAHASCHTSSTSFGTFTTNNDGNWFSQQVTMPTASGSNDYTQCATYPANGTATDADDSGSVANFTVT